MNVATEPSNPPASSADGAAQGSPAATPPGREPPAHALFGAVRSTALMTLGSRVFGLIRDVLIGRIFGDTALNSNFQAAFAIPNMFRRLFGEGALSAAFIPQYTQADKADPQQAHRLASLTLAYLAAVTSGLTILVEIVLTAVLALGHHSDERRLLIELVMVMLPFMPLICMVAILAGMLQVHGRFAAAASGPLLLNGFIIGVGGYAIATDWKAGTTIAFVLGIATVLSAATQLWWFGRLLRPYVTWTRQYRDPAVRERARAMMRKFVPVAIGLGTLQLNTFLDTSIATFPIWFDTARKGIAFPLDDSSNGILALTSRLYQFPLGVFGIAVASAAFPLLARHADDKHKFTETLRRGLRLSLFIGLPATLGLMLVRHELTAVLFGYGKKGFTTDGLNRSAAVLAGFAPGVWAYSLNHVYTRAFYARGDTRTPMKLSMLSVLVNLGLNLTLIWHLREAGMAWATGAAAMAQCAALTILARRRLADGSVIDSDTRTAFAKVVAASVLMSLAVWATRAILPSAGTWAGQLTTLIASCGVGIAAYLALSAALRVHELRWLVSRKDARL